MIFDDLWYQNIWKSLGNPWEIGAHDVLRCPSSPCCGSFQGSRWSASWACWTPRPIWSSPGVEKHVERHVTFNQAQSSTTTLGWLGTEKRNQVKKMQDLASPVDNGSWPLDAERLSQSRLISNFDAFYGRPMATVLHKGLKARVSTCFNPWNPTDPTGPTVAGWEEKTAHCGMLWPSLSRRHWGKW